MHMEWLADMPDERLMKLQVLAFVEEYCRGLTLRDARELYVEAFDPEPSGDALHRA